MPGPILISLMLLSMVVYTPLLHDVSTDFSPALRKTLDSSCEKATPTVFSAGRATGAVQLFICLVADFSALCNISSMEG